MNTSIPETWHDEFLSLQRPQQDRILGLTQMDGLLNSSCLNMTESRRKNEEQWRMQELSWEGAANECRENRLGDSDANSKQGMKI